MKAPGSRFDASNRFWCFGVAGRCLRSFWTILCVGIQSHHPFPQSPGLCWRIAPQAPPVALKRLPQLQRPAFRAGVGRINDFMIGVIGTDDLRRWVQPCDA